jgi:Xaa-Pro aminopeptidase
VEHLGALKAKRAAFEAEFVTVAQHERLLADLVGVELVSAHKVVEEQRIIKDPEEVAYIRQAAHIMDRVLARVVRGLQAGMTERDVARQLEAGVSATAAEGMGFETIVAFGSHAAHPHAVPGRRKLRAGQVVKIDCGAMVEGYRSDITRTHFFGEPDAKFRRVYNAVFRAQAAAVAAVRPGATGAELDAVARSLLAEEGLAEQFGHGLGHGVGLNVHEAPGLGARSEDVMKPGMVVTVEPGVYLEGWGGVRIEDTVLVTKDGCEPLTRAAKLKVKA